MCRIILRGTRQNHTTSERETGMTYPVRIRKVGRSKEALIKLLLETQNIISPLNDAQTAGGLQSRSYEVSFEKARTHINDGGKDCA